MNDDAFAELYRQHAPGIRHYVFRRTSCRDVAADLCQETFLRLLKALRAGVQIDNGKAFAFRIAHNLVIDYYRERSRAFVGSFEAMTASVGRQEGDSDALYGTLDLDHWLRDPSDLEAEVVTRITMDDALRYLGHAVSPQQATVFRLRHEGYAYAEIGQMLDLTPGAAKATQVRCYANLRERMAA